MSINLKNFAVIKVRGEEVYRSFAPVKCPYFSDLVHFNAQGLKHLKFKSEGFERKPEDQYMRFKLLYLAPLVLKLSGTVQAISRRKGFEYVRKNNKTELVVVERTYYEFIAIITDVRVRIVVKQIDGGQLYFWSIIPFWKTDVSRRVFNFGNPESD